MAGSSTRQFWLPALLLLVLLLVLCPQPAQSSPADRRRRQTFDFSGNTPSGGSNSSGDHEDPGAAGAPPSGETGSSGVDLGSALAGLLGTSDAVDNSSTSPGGEPNGEGVGAGGGLGGGLGNLFDPSDPADNSSAPSSDQAWTPSWDIPWGDLFDPSEPADNSSSPGVDTGGSDTDCAQNAWLCQGLYHCFNGGTCVVNGTTCIVRCVCPPPYDDRRHYDKHCNALGTSTTTAPHPPFSSATASPPSGLATTLRPLSERTCEAGGLLVCVHGYCQVNNVTKGQYCVCDHGWRNSRSCDVPCSRNCSNDGVCQYDSTTDTEVCECRHPWVGPNCTDVPPEVVAYLSAGTELVAWLGGAFAVGIVVLLALGALFMFCLWRKRLVFAMKFVYFFKPYEDHDGKLYDAFVSYVSRNEDEDFVYSTLYPKLEQEMGFRLCLHQRDFVIGDMISNNILNALDNSRRFILVLSPRYLNSAWAEFEYQRAFQEMLNFKMRIIPIILEDISQCDSINPTLKAILQSVTYITYPGTQADERQMHKFWKRVHLSMPKRKSTDTSETNAGHDSVPKVPPCPTKVPPRPTTATRVQSSSWQSAGENDVVKASVPDSVVCTDKALRDSSADDKSSSTAESASTTTTVVPPNVSNGDATAAWAGGRLPVTELSDVMLQTGSAGTRPEGEVKVRSITKGWNIFKTVFGWRKGKPGAVRLEGFHDLGDFALSSRCENSPAERVQNGDLSKARLTDEIGKLETRLQSPGGLTSA